MNVIQAFAAELRTIAPNFDLVFLLGMGMLLVFMFRGASR